MQTLGLSLRTKGPEGEALPSVFRGLDMYGAKIRRGQLSLIGAAPNGGKSSFATYIAMTMRHEHDKDPIPTLYFSADSDVTTFGMRAGAIALKEKLVSEVEGLILNKDQDTLKVIEKSTDHIWVCFDSSPSCRDIQEEVDIYALLNGEYPHFIVVDNLMDVRTTGSEWKDQDSVLDFLKQLARKTQAAVLVLCHVVGQYTDGSTVIPRSGLINKIDKRPRLILTLYNVDYNMLGVCIVKNNNGQCDAEGNLEARIPWTKERMWFGGA